jgi:uncharacterized membrane protein
VAAVAVLLSIRHESIFIAVLGLLGGFSTPALLSTGENRPIPLFAYLLLLNLGLAWVARARAWPVLTGLSLVLTTLYQWAWVFKFLDAAQLTLAGAIFLVFPAASLGVLALARRREAARRRTDVCRTRRSSGPRCRCSSRSTSRPCPATAPASASCSGCCS